MTGIWIPKMGHSEYKVIGREPSSQPSIAALDDDIDRDLLETLHQSLNPKKHQILPVSSSDDTPAPKQQKTVNIVDTKKCRHESIESTSDIDFDCRCSEIGYGHIDDVPMSQRAVMCDKCDKWSHLACAQGIECPDAPFLCYHCAPDKPSTMDQGLKLQHSNRM